MPGSEHRRVSCVVPTPERPLFEQGVCAACNTLWLCEVARLQALLAERDAEISGLVEALERVSHLLDEWGGAALAPARRGGVIEARKVARAALAARGDGPAEIESTEYASVARVEPPDCEWGFENGICRSTATHVVTGRYRYAQEGAYCSSHARAAVAALAERVKSTMQEGRDGGE